MMYFERISQWSYWFDVQALAFSETAFWIFVSWLAVLVLLFIGLRIAAHRIHANPPLAHFLVRISRGVMAYGIVSALFLLFRTEEAILIGMRFWYALATLIFVARTLRLMVKFHRNYDKERAALEERRRLERYLPKGRK